MRRRRPSRTVTVYSTVTHNTHQDGAIREDTRDRAPEWTKLADALEEHDDEEIEGCNDDINTLLTFVSIIITMLKKTSLSDTIHDIGRTVLCCGDCF